LARSPVVDNETATHQTDEEKGAIAMETYIMLTKLTDEGRKTLKNNPKRTQEVNKGVEAMGGKVMAQ